MGRSKLFVEPENRTDGTRRLKRERPDVESLQLAAGFVDRALGERRRSPGGLLPDDQQD
jgi:hypothetical protein